ncbi:hypothetical protein ACHWQZ_G001200 [Mnemiopsis leidyi]
MLGSETPPPSDTNNTFPTEELGCLYTAPNWYQSHVIACNGTHIAYGARNMIQILSLDLVPIRMLSSHPKRVTTVCFTEEDVLVSGCDGGVVMVWCVRTGTILSTLLSSPISVGVVVCRGRRVFSGDEKGIVCVWEDFKKGKTFSRFQPFSEKIMTMSCSDQEDVTLAIGYRMGTIAIMSVKGSEMTLVHTLKGHDMDIFRVSWCKKSYPNLYSMTSSDTPIENLLVSTSRDKSIKLWDGANNRLIRSLLYPPKMSSARESNLNREQPWASVIWTSSGIVASSATGDIACLEEVCTEDGISELKWKSFDSPHAHSKKVFALSDVGNNQIVSTSMDRETILWRAGECVKVAHGLGGFAYGLDISPLAPNRIAVATGDNMVRIWEPYQDKVLQVWQSVRTKVMVVTWHPYKEGIVSFGTEEGRIGIYDVNSGSMNTSSTYHEKPVYSMSWGYVPTKFPDDPLKTGLYSCGGEGTIFCHKLKELGKAAVNVNSYLAAENKYKHQPPARTAVDWEYKSHLLAVGSSNGVIEIFKAPNLQLLTVFQYHTRIINKLRWGRNEGEKVLLDIHQEDVSDVEPSDTPADIPQLLLGSCSDDNLICIQDLSSITPSTTPTLKSHQTLRGHTARITDIDWNPHNYKQIVSSSYDGTAQVWDVESGAGVSSFRGHAGRVFSVRWSHTKLDCVFSGSDEFTVRQWRISDNAEKIPPKVNPLAPPNKSGNNRKKKRGAKKNVVISENKVEVVSESDKANTWRKSQPSQEESLPEPVDDTEIQPDKVKSEPITVSVSDVKRKRGSKGKSLLPLASRRDHCSKSDQADQIIQIAKEVFTTNPSCNESLTIADTGLYTSRSNTFKLVCEERKNHTAENHHHQAALLGIWSSDISRTVDLAIQTKTVTESLLSVAVMCGMDKYQEAVRCFISQLSASRDFVTAASYLLILGETHKAIDMLVSEECYREALTIAKMRLAPEDDTIRSIYEKWAMKQEREMQFDSAIKCYLASGEARRAIMVMLRRKDVASLETTLQVAEIVGEKEMLPAIRAALEEARLTEEAGNVVENGKSEADCEGVNGFKEGEENLGTEPDPPPTLQNGS